MPSLRSTRRGFALMLVPVLAAGGFRTAGAQRVDQMRAGVGARPPAQDTIDRPTVNAPSRIAVAAPSARGETPSGSGPRGPAGLRPWSPIASAIVPGTGQFLLGKDRFVAYLAVEAITWFKYEKDQRDQATEEAAFKDIARRVARAHFSTTFPDSSWSYYEAMRDYLESGVYSESDVGPVQPETDTTTYNGAKWLLELRTHSTYAQALAAYEHDAIGPAYRWSWRNAQLQYDLFAQTTEKRNSAFRRSAQDLMILGANHVLSMVDAFAAFRLGTTTLPNGATGIGASVRW